MNATDTKPEHDLNRHLQKDYKQTDPKEDHLDAINQERNLLKKIIVVCVIVISLLLFLLACKFSYRVSQGLGTAELQPGLSKINPLQNVTPNIWVTTTPLNKERSLHDDQWKLVSYNDFKTSPQEYLKSKTVPNRKRSYRKASVRLIQNNNNLSLQNHNKELNYKEPTIETKSFHPTFVSHKTPNTFNRFNNFKKNGFRKSLSYAKMKPWSLKMNFQQAKKYSFHPAVKKPHFMNSKLHLKV